MDDKLIKSKSVRTHIDDLGEAFAKYEIKLNSAKCAFGVISEKFLGVMVSSRGIEVNSKKIKAMQEMAPPQMIKEVQHLTGRITILNQFVSRSVKWCLPFF